jgi:pimeloyl-ACP methyl ester carboxylesterase
MPLILLARLIMSMLSLALLGAGVYWLWSWWEGQWILGADGLTHHVRDNWRLWAAIGLLAWSVLGRLVVLPLISRPDKDPTRALRFEGRTLPSPSGNQLYLEDHGPRGGPTVILTHGWGLDSTIWFYLRRRLATEFRVVTWDLPGLGKSRAGRGRDIDLSHFAQDLKAVIDSLDGPVVLVGHSIGGMTIQTLARDYPAVLVARVAGVVLVNTTYTNPLRTMALSPLAKALRWPVLEPLLRLAILLQPLAWLSTWQSYLSGSAHLANRIGFASHVTRSQLEHTTLLATRNPPAASARGNLAMFRWDSEAGPRALEVAALIIAGSQDLVTKPAASETLASMMPSARLQIIDDANHMGFLERPEVYNEAVAQFCAARLAGAQPTGA